MPQETPCPKVGETDLTSEVLFKSLQSDVCPACSAKKLPKHTFCGNDYYRLPVPARRALYNRLGRGYDAAVKTALDILQSGREGGPVFFLEAPKLFGRKARSA